MSTLKEILKIRRSYRALEPTEITDEMIYELAGAAQLMPSCFNNQPWRYIFVREEPYLQQLKDEALSPGNRWATAASLIIAVISKKDYDCVLGPREYYYFDVGMGTGSLLLRATELGLVAHPIAGYNPEKTREILHIPEDLEVITLIIVGKWGPKHMELLSEDQKKREVDRPERKELNEFVFLNKYSE